MITLLMLERERQLLHRSYTTEARTLSKDALARREAVEILDCIRSAGHAAIDIGASPP